MASREIWFDGGVGVGEREGMTAVSIYLTVRVSVPSVVLSHVCKYSRGPRRYNQ